MFPFLCLQQIFLVHSVMPWQLETGKYNDLKPPWAVTIKSGILRAVVLHIKQQGSALFWSRYEDYCGDYISSASVIKIW